MQFSGKTKILGTGLLSPTFLGMERSHPSETAWTSETLLDDKPPCQCVVTRQLKEVWDLLDLRVFLRRARPLFLCWCYQHFEFLQGCGGTGKAMCGHESAELLQPLVKTDWEVRL